MITETFNVGQKVWFEPDDEREKGFYSTIIKVGRIYYTIDKWNIKVCQRHPLSLRISERTFI